MTMQQASVQVVSVVLVLCNQHTILNRMVKAAQHMLGGFFCMCKKLRTIINIMFLQIIFNYVKNKQTLKMNIK